MNRYRIPLLLLNIIFGVFNSPLQAQKFEDYKATSMGRGYVTVILLNKEAKALASGTSQGAILVRDLETNKLTHILKKHTAPITALSFHPFGIYLASTSTDGSVSLWDLSKGMQAEPIRTLVEADKLTGGVPQLSFVYFNAAGDTLYYGGSTGKVNAINPFEAEPKPITVRTYDKPLSSTAYDVASNRLAISHQTSIQLLNLNTRQTEKSIETCQEWILDIAFSADGKQIACLCKDGNFTLIDHASEQIVQSFKLSKIAPLAEIALSPDGKYVAMATTDNALRTWDLKTRELTNKLVGHQAAIRTITVTPDSKMILSGGEDKQVKTWKWRKVYENEEIPIREDELNTPELTTPDVDFKPMPEIEDLGESIPSQPITTDSLVSAKKDEKIEVTKKIILPKKKLKLPRNAPDNKALEEAAEEIVTASLPAKTEEKPVIAPKKKKEVVQPEKKPKPTLSLRPKPVSTKKTVQKPIKPIAKTVKKPVEKPTKPIVKEPIEKAPNPKTVAALNRLELSYNKRNVADSLGERKLKGIKSALLRGDEVTIEVWDDQHEDGDTISLYFNGRWVLTEYLLRKSKKKITLKINKGVDNYLLLYAHNEGSRPPNTAALNLYDGHKKRRVDLKSTLKSCGGINIKYFEK